MTTTRTHLSNWQVPFFTIWIGQQLSWIGSSVAGFALVWWLTRTTGSATVLATATLVNILPGVALGPFVGALVDRWNRRQVMLIADAIIALFSAWLAYLFWSGHIQVWHVYLIMFIRSVGGAFHWPAMTASTSLMVPQEHLPRVSGLNQTMSGAVNIVAPPLSALLMSLLPLHAIMGIDVVTAVLAITPLLFTHIPQPRPAETFSAGNVKPTLWADMRAGFHYVWGWPGLLAVCLLAMALNFLINPAMSLMPLLVTKHFHGDAFELGWLNSAWGGGLVVGGLLLSVWGGFRQRILTVLTGIVGLGVGVLVVGIAPARAFPLAVGGLLFGAIMNALCNGAAFALLQQVVAPGMQGRVFTLITSMCNAATPLSMMIAGPLADRVGVRTLYVVGGAVQIALGLGGFFVPAIMSIERNNRNGHLVAAGGM